MFNQRINNVRVPAVEAHADAANFLHGGRIRRRCSRCFRLLLGSSKRSAASTTSAASTEAARSGQRRGPGSPVPRQTFFQFLPGGSAIGGLIHGPPGAPAVEAKYGAASLSGAG